MFSCIPAAPLPPKYQFRTKSLLIEDLTSKEKESDAESLFNSIPAPPPPAVTLEILEKERKNLKVVVFLVQFHPLSNLILKLLRQTHKAKVKANPS